MLTDTEIATTSTDKDQIYWIDCVEIPHGVGHWEMKCIPVWVEDKEHAGRKICFPTGGGKATLGEKPKTKGRG